MFSTLKIKAENLLKQILAEDPFEFDDHLEFAQNFQTIRYQTLYYLSVLLNIKPDFKKAIEIGLKLVTYQNPRDNIDNLESENVKNLTARKSLHQDNSLTQIEKHLTAMDAYVAKLHELELEKLHQHFWDQIFPQKTSSHQQTLFNLERKTDSQNTLIVLSHSIRNNQLEMVLTHWNNLSKQGKEDLIKLLKEKETRTASRAYKAKQVVNESPITAFIWLKTIDDKDYTSLGKIAKLVYHLTLCQCYSFLDFDKTVIKH